MMNVQNYNLFSERYSKVSSSSQDWENICKNALLRLERVCGEMKTGNISIEEVKLLSNNEQLKSLCSAASSSPEIPDIPELESLLTRREIDYNYFLQFLTKLVYFIDHMKNLLIKGKFKEE